MSKETQRQSRYQTLTFDMGKPVAVDGFSVRSDGMVSLISKGEVVTPVSTSVGEFRRTPKKEKILARVPATSPNLSQIHPVAALGAFDAVFAVDTGSKIINGEHIHFSVFSEGVFRRRGNVIEEMRAKIVAAVEFRGFVEKPEQMGWLFLLTSLDAMQVLNGDKQIVIITDSELGNHAEYNNQARPIFDAKYLPKNVHLAYASGDSGNDNISKLIRLCDKAATGFLLQAQQRYFPKIANSVRCGTHSIALRRWRPNKSGWEYSPSNDNLTQQMLIAAGWDGT